VFVGKVLIENLVLSLPEWSGRPGGWNLVRDRPEPARRVLLTGVVLCGAITIARLEPFDFQAPAQAFGWLPFRSFMAGR